MIKYHNSETNETVTKLPVVWRHNGKSTIGLTEDNMGSFGWEKITEEDPVPNLTIYTDLDSATAIFRGICSEIELALSISDFRGGFDELLALTPEQHNTLRSTGLIDRLNLIDRLCNHEANKVGLQAPAWWYRCWA